MPLDTSKLVPYKPAAYPSLDGGMSTYLTTEFRRISQAVTSLEEILAAVATGADASFLLKADNLSDVTAATARTNLGLGSAATHAATDFPLVSNNLSDLANSADACTNLGLNAPFVAFTPTITAVTGTLTTVSVVYAAYQQFGKLVVARYRITFTNIGSASGAIKFTQPSAASAQGLVSGFNIYSNKPLSGLCGWGASTSGRVVNYDGSFPVANGQDLIFYTVYDVP